MAWAASSLAMGGLQPVMARRFLAASVVGLLLNVAPLEHFAWISLQQKSNVPSPFRRPVSRPDFCDIVGIIIDNLRLFQELIRDHLIGIRTPNVQMRRNDFDE
jgi:hypothetical protein